MFQHFFFYLQPDGYVFPSTDWSALEISQNLCRYTNWCDSVSFFFLFFVLSSNLASLGCIALKVELLKCVIVYWPYKCSMCFCFFLDLCALHCCTKLNAVIIDMAISFNINTSLSVTTLRSRSGIKTTGLVYQMLHMLMEVADLSVCPSSSFSLQYSTGRMDRNETWHETLKTFESRIFFLSLSPVWAGDGTL